MGKKIMDIMVRAKEHCIGEGWRGGGGRCEREIEEEMIEVYG